MPSLAFFLFATAAVAGDLGKPVEFAREVRPILQARCVACHGAAKQSGGLRLDTAHGLRLGGDSGAALVAGASAKSLLIDHVAGRNEAARMPPRGAPLATEQIDALRRWIDQGAAAPDDAPAAALPAADGWAWQPLRRPPTPRPADAERIRTPVDAFVQAKLRACGLRPSPEADRRTLLRRLALDLTGLPPLPEETDEFRADVSADAYERQVERLLASPRHGERWARHWLDVVHYADSHGQEHDKPRPNAWPYRDYVVRSLNADKPYGRFVREQIAGDVLFPGDAEALRATGFLAAGPWDESALVTIKDDTLDRRAAQYLDRDDIATSALSTFAGLTVGCARCHDHKFDPIPQADYYALQAVFAGVEKADREYDADPALGRRRAALTAEKGRWAALAGKADPSLRTPAALAAAAAADAACRAREAAWETPEPVRWSAADGTILKALQDRSILAVGPRPERDTYRIEVATDRRATAALRLELLADETLPQHGPGRQDNGNLHIDEIAVRAKPRGADGAGTPVRIVRAAADANEAPVYGVEKAIDGNPATFWGIYPAVGRSHRATFEFDRPVGFPGGTTFVVEIAQRSGNFHTVGRLRLALSGRAPVPADLEVPPEALDDLLALPAERRSPEQTDELARRALLAGVEQELAGLPPPSAVYAAKPVAPKPVHVLTRGDPARLGPLAAPGAIATVNALPARFAVSASADEGARRAALAEWLAHRDNPLPWRTIANRVWQGHFGRGLVDTPNDLGKMGGAPSHPELLDWLAAELRETGSLKRLHRTIVLSATYRQQARHDAAAAAQDADNRLLWRMNRRRLDAESVRDAALLAAGRLDETMFGPPARQFVERKGVADTPAADYEALDLDRPDARRRGIYRFVFRTRPDPFLAALDCPDFSLSAPVRIPTLSALQALALWNNAFMLRQAECLAQWAERQAREPAARVRFVARRLFGRAPDADESAAWTAYAAKHGLPNLCRVLLNGSEFQFID